MTFTVYPAIDLRHGTVVRLHQGDYAQSKQYDMTPEHLARGYRAQGAEWLHLVDLEGARSGTTSLHSHVRAISDATGLKVQVGGGVREANDVERLLGAGAKRVVIGSLAVVSPERVIEWLHDYGADALTIALDTRRDERGDWRLPIHGWTKNSTESLFTLAHAYAQAGLKHLLCTDISRDGTLSGPAIALYAELHERFPTLSVQASGGIRDAEDVRSVLTSGCAGVVIGKSLLEGSMRLSEALLC